MQSFDVLSVELKGSNLIEASAGTGKTYSLGILVLRLIIEKQIPIKEILMVTFTNAAVAELKERIRKFVREAYKYSTGSAIDDRTIMQVVDKNKTDDIADILKSNLLQLDELPIFTIHTFCKKTLSEFAFETKQDFNSELLQDVSLITNKFLNNFWRSHINILPVEILEKLYSINFSKDNIAQILKDHFNDKFYSAEGDVSELLERIKKDEEEREEIFNFLDNAKEELIKICASNHHSKSSFLPFQNGEKFYNDFKGKYLSNKRPAYLKNLKEFFFKISEHIDLVENLFLSLRDVLIRDAINFVLHELEIYKSAKGISSFSDMIAGMRTALDSAEGTILSEELMNKYKAVFIDEFQDTDPAQYDIFTKAFDKQRTIIFLIGDPKQSIYSFRSSDIQTYFKARDFVDKIWEMNTNFRSTQKYIDSLNSFFNLTDDPFFFKGEEQSIEYINVCASPLSAKIPFTENDVELNGISVIAASENYKNADSAVSIIEQLLIDDKFKINSKKILPSDITVLVRWNRTGKEIKRLLNKKGIASIVVDESKVTNSKEADFMYYLLVSFENIKQENINRVLFGSYAGFTKDKLKELDQNESAALFNKYKTKWSTQGLYSAISSFMLDFQVYVNLKSDERALTNLYQLTELLHKIQTNRNLSNPETIGWLKRARAGRVEGDEYIQRIESDENAVTIASIHRSKGLAYNIVLAPELELTHTAKSNDLKYYRNKEGKNILKLFSDFNEDEKELYYRQQEQENRRLIYVTMTRAVYKTFLFVSGESKAASSLSPFLLKENELLNFYNAGQFQSVYNFKPEETKIPLTSVAENFKLLSQFWRRTSYSNLAVKPRYVYKEKGNEADDEYEKFIFNELSGGIQTGNLLHQIFEKISFSQNEKWNDIISNLLRRNFRGAPENLCRNLEKMAFVVFNTKIAERLFLKDVKPEKMLHEFEFNFPLSVVTYNKFAGLQNEEYPFAIRDFKEMEGIMNGFIDLFFEYDGKYYILDWKSNYLGKDLSYYSQDAINNAMAENNYHLQYLIYTVAIKRYLEKRKPGFNYEKDFGGIIYLFVRGIREGKDSGIFFRKPSVDYLNKFESIFSN